MHPSLWGRHAKGTIVLRPYKSLLLQGATSTLRYHWASLLLVESPLSGASSILSAKCLAQQLAQR